MTASTQFKGLLAGVAAFALIGTAIAQGNPPNPAVKSAPVGAGQQSSQGTPMGTTGTPTGATGATTGSTAAGSTSSGMTMGTASGSTSSGSSMGSSSTSADTATTTTKRPMRTARADRN